MRSRLLGSAAAVLSTAFAAAADPVPHPSVSLPPVTVAPLEPQALPGPSRFPWHLAVKAATVTPANPLAPRPPERFPTVQTKEEPPAKKQEAPPPRPRTKTEPDDSPKVAPLGPPVAHPVVLSEPCGECPPVKFRPQPSYPDPWNCLWVGGGYSLLWIKPAPVGPVLAATGPLGPGSQVLFGQTDRGFGGFNSLFLHGGIWLGCERQFGLGLAGFWTDERSSSTVIASNGTSVIARPFFNPLLVAVGGQDAILVAAPGQFAGSLSVDATAQMGGGEVNGYLRLTNTPNCTTTLVAGFRYFDLEESLSIVQATQGLNGNTIPFFGNLAGVSSVRITDLFQTRNQFYGGQVGLETEYRFGALFVDGGAKVGLGPVHQVTEVTGQTLGPDGLGGSGGVLAVGSRPIGNIGRTTTNRFSVLSDVYGMIGVQLSDRIRVGVGYQFLYLNSVARPGHQIATTIDPRLIPITPSFGGLIPTNPLGAPPQAPFDRDDFFTHGVRFLIELHF